MRVATEEWRIDVGQGQRVQVVKVLWFTSFGSVAAGSIRYVKYLNVAVPKCCLFFVHDALWVSCCCRCLFAFSLEESRKSDTEASKGIDRTKWDRKFLIDFTDFICSSQNGSAHHPQPLHTNLLKSLGGLAAAIFSRNISLEYRKPMKATCANRGSHFNSVRFVCRW